MKLILNEEAIKIIDDCRREHGIEIYIQETSKTLDVLALKGDIKRRTSCSKDIWYKNEDNTTKLKSVVNWVVRRVKQIEKIMNLKPNHNKSKIYNLWNEFCNEIQFKPLTSQFAYFSSLIENGIVKGSDRGTGKTTLIQKIILFNEKYKLWRIRYWVASNYEKHEMHTNIISFLGHEPVNCIFKSNKDMEDIESKNCNNDFNDFDLFISEYEHNFSARLRMDLKK